VCLAKCRFFVRRSKKVQQKSDVARSVDGALGGGGRFDELESPFYGVEQSTKSLRTCLTPSRGADYFEFVEVNVTFYRRKRNGQDSGEPRVLDHLNHIKQAYDGEAAEKQFLIGLSRACVGAVRPRICRSRSRFPLDQALDCSRVFGRQADESNPPCRCAASCSVPRRWYGLLFRLPEK